MHKTFILHNDVPSLRQSAVKGCYLCQMILDLVESRQNLYQRARPGAESPSDFNTAFDGGEDTATKMQRSSERHSPVIDSQMPVTLRCDFPDRDQRSKSGMSLIVAWGRKAMGISESVDNHIVHGE